MIDFFVIAMLALGVILAIAVVLIIVQAKNKKINKDDKKPEGYYVSLGISIGTSLGIAIGLAAFDNIALGLPIGVAIGVAIGAAWEKEHKEELRPLTDEEKANKKKAPYILLGLIILGVILGVAAFLVMAK